MIYGKYYLGLAASTLLVSCGQSGTENIHFITSSEISIGVDPVLGKANVGYDRNELVITTGTTDTGNGESGNIPALYAELQSNRNLTSPEIIQFYATGEAAARVTSDPNKRLSTVATEESFKKHKTRAIIFGTSTNLGLNVKTGIEGQVPAFNLGYKRREASRIPLSKDSEETPHKLPSLLAHMRVNSDSKIDKRKDAANSISTALPFDFKAGQLIATGVAAENLAGSQALRKVISRRAVIAATDGLNCKTLDAVEQAKCEAEARQEATE